MISELSSYSPCFASTKTSYWLCDASPFDVYNKRRTRRNLLAGWPSLIAALSCRPRHRHLPSLLFCPYPKPVFGSFTIEVVSSPNLAHSPPFSNRL
jgi:hypothetical protein